MGIITVLTRGGEAGSLSLRLGIGTIVVAFFVYKFIQMRRKYEVGVHALI